MRRLLLLVVFVAGCALDPHPKAVQTAPGPRIEWPSAYADQVHFPLYLDDSLPICIQVRVPDQPQGADVLCETLNELRWQIKNRRSTR